MKNILKEKIKVGVIQADESILETKCVGLDNTQIALVVGSAPCLWDDLDKYMSMSSFNKADIALVNLSALSFFRDKATYLITLHPELASSIKTLRNNRSSEYLVCHSTKCEEGVDFAWSIPDPQYGFSGFFAARILVSMGYSKVVLCGCPNNNTGHFYDDPINKRKSQPVKHGEDVCKSQIDHYKKDLLGKVKSFSGFTKELFGEPTAEWITR